MQLLHAPTCSTYMGPFKGALPSFASHLSPKNLTLSVIRRVKSFTAEIKSSLRNPPPPPPRAAKMPFEIRRTMKSLRADDDAAALPNAMFQAR